MPRTAKQLAQAKRLSAQTFGPQKELIIGSNAGLPKSSWWAGTTREEFDQRLAHEAKRMRFSSFGHSKGRLNIGD